MTFLGVWVCQYRELKPISFGGHRVTPAGAQANGANTTPESLIANGDEERGFGRGRGRGRGKDGAGEYEMVGISDQADPG